MTDELSIPQVPESKPDDPEDVSWALSTAEAMWARGDHADGIKWVRRAAEAASEADKDARALELAKAAADLQALLARRTNMESVDLDDITVSAPAPPPVPQAWSASFAPPKPSVAPAKAAPGAPKPLAAVSPSRVPAPLPSRLSAAPPAPTVATKQKAPPAAESKPASKAPPPAESKPAAKAPPAAEPKPAAKAGMLPRAATSSAKKRRSRENLEAEARAALQVPETSRTVALDSSTDLIDTAETVAIQVPHRKKAPESPPTTGRIVAPPSSKQPTAAAVRHDPNIVPSQAIKVVVWRDGSGVHVAPAGTVVSAITVDAILVALEPDADLTAWLGGDGEPRR